MAAISGDVRPAELVWPAEVAVLAANAKNAGRWLRVTGRVLQVNVRTRRALLEHRGAAVAVTLDLLPGVVLRPRSLVQLMGCLVPDDEDADAEGGADVLVLQARQVRPVDGLDVRVYERALAVRRAALGEAMPP